MQHTAKLHFAAIAVPMLIAVYLAVLLVMFFIV
jgi:hypothetical protein